ncbi:MAG: 30S ribosomal protein S2 [Patescibacteria group bacterium]
MSQVKNIIKDALEGMFAVGAHFGYQRGRRHPSSKPYIFGSKNRVDIIDLEKTTVLLDGAKEFVKSLAASGKQILFVGTKPEAREAVLAGAERLGMPYVTLRWVGGTLTNFSEIKKRMDRYQELAKKKEEGGLSVYTKKERGIFDRELTELKENFGGLLPMKNFPGALFVIDSRAESIAVAEAGKIGIPVVSLSNSDCDLKPIAYPIVGNDSARSSIAFFVGEIENAYRQGLSPEKQITSNNN